MEHYIFGSELNIMIQDKAHVVGSRYGVKKCAWR